MSAARYVLGLGASSSAEETDAISLATQVLDLAGIEAGSLAAIATLDRRADHPALSALSEHLGVPIRGLRADALLAEADRLATPSPAAERHAGLPGVAEAAALALAGPGGSLAVSKRTGRGVTATLARLGPAE